MKDLRKSGILSWLVGGALLAISGVAQAAEPL